MTKSGVGLSNQMDAFTTAPFNVTDWLDYTDNYWHYMMYTDNDNILPDQGWKIHITATINEAQRLLYDVSNYLIQHRISFKFAVNKNELIQKNSKYADRAASGKFVTIYPHNEKEFVELLKPLERITSIYHAGPYILNDKQWHNSNVFFRYGGFSEMMMNYKGNFVAAIKDNRGNLVPDKRVPYYYVPPFVKEPKEIQQTLGGSGDSTFEELQKYKNIKAIHFSDAGGVYKASKDNKQLILKEGRPQAGLDANGLSGYDRVKREYSFLKKLIDVPSVVTPVNYFVAWKHNYLVENMVQGSPLEDYVATKFPFMLYSNPAKKAKDKSVYDYLLHVKVIISNIFNALDAIHNHGIAICDLQTNNIMVSKDDSVTLIDFETADIAGNKYVPGLQTPEFAPNIVLESEQADWFALKRIVSFLFMPVMISEKLVPGISRIKLNRVKDVFGEETVKYINSVTEAIDRKAQYTEDNTDEQHHFLTLPNKRVDVSSVDNIVWELRKGLLENMNVKTSALIKGNPIYYRFPMSNYTIDHGAFGGIMALLRSKKDADEISILFKEWLNKQRQQVLFYLGDPRTKLGLFDGITGICSCLYEIGDRNTAIMLFKKVLKKVDRGQLDFSIYSGLAGIGLESVAFYQITKDKYFIEKAKNIARKIISNFQSNILVQGSKPKRSYEVGLLNGLAGESLFLLKLYEIDEQNELFLMASKIIDHILNYDVSPDGEAGLLTTNFDRHTSRALPYLDDGSIGLALVMLEFYRHDHGFLNKGNRKVQLKKLINSSFMTCSANGGLFGGYAGTLVLANALKNLFHDNSLMEFSLKGLNLFIFRYGRHELFIPADLGYKCSLDLSSGTSGLLLAMSDLRCNHWNSWLPLPEVQKMNIFSRNS